MKLSALDEEQIQAILRLAASQLALQQHRQAYKTYDSILKIIPAHAEALFGQAQVAKGQKKRKLEIRYLQELLSVHPYHQAAALELANAAPIESIPYLEACLESHPTDPLLLLKLGQILILAHRFESARFHLEQLLRFQPDSHQAAEAWLELAHLALRTGELAEAVKGFERAIALHSGLKQDPRYVNLESKWKSIETQHQQLDLTELWQKIESRS